MEQHQTSAVRTPSKSIVVQRRSKSKSYLGIAASRIGLTPALTARRLNTSRRAPKAHNITEKVHPEHVDLLVKFKWQLSYVTPLYQFRHTQLISYSRQLSAFIAAERQQGLAVEVEGMQDNFRVSFSIIQGMAETDDDAETILVQIHSKSSFMKKDEPPKMVWSGWLTCIKGNPDYLHSLPSDFTCLPLFGSSGAEGLTSLVKSWFQQAFDCSFGPLEINYTTLQWLMALWTSCHAESNIQQLRMTWNLPVEPPLKVDYNVNGQNAWELWCSVRKASTEQTEDVEEDCIDIEEVMNFMQGLKSHFYRHFKLDLSAGNLNMVSTALGSASLNGKIKISNSKYLITTLALLTECALFKMPF